MAHHPNILKLTDTPDINILISWRQTIALKWQQVLDAISYEDTRPVLITKQFVDNILDFVDKKHDVKSYATSQNASSDNLAHICKAVTGLSPSVLIELYLLKKAILMLDSGENDINKVASELGFKSHSHFTTFFKCHCLLAPSVYRKMMSDYRHR